MDLNWSEETFSIQSLVESVDFPQLLQVSFANPKSLPPNKSANSSRNSINDGISHYAEKSQSTRCPLKEGDVLKLHGIRTFKKVIVTGAGAPSPQTSCEQVATEYGYLSPPGSTTIYRQFSLPMSYSTPLSILPFRDLKHVFATAGDLVEEKPRPSAVIVNKTISLPEKNCIIKEGDVLAITSVDKRCTSAGVVDFLICKHNDKTIGLPRSCVGNFTVLQDETLFTLNDLVSKHGDIGLPQKICFHPTKTQSQCETLARGGAHLIVPGGAYIAENVVKQQYLICTKCEENNNSLPHTKVYYIPTNCAVTKRTLKVRRPMFHDMKSYTYALNSKYCPNLCIRDILDATPIEYVGEQDITVRNLSHVYDITSPQLPPRKDFNTSDLVSIRSASSQCLDQYEGSSNYANVQVPPILNGSESNLTGLVNMQGGGSHSRSMILHSRSNSEQMFTGEEQPLLGDAGSSSAQQPKRLGGSNKTPVMKRRGASTPCTPETRRKKAENPTWTEKISISLENLKRTFRKAGSEERERTKIGDGSQLADSFENLSMCGSNEGADSTSSSSNYENVKFVAGQLNKPVGRTRPMLKQPSAIPPSKCTQIRELWTPPCSPDYRDHTTPQMQLPSIHTGYTQFNNSNSNQVAYVRPNTEFQFNQLPGSNNNPKPPAPEPPTSSNYYQFELPKYSKSPKAAPRQIKDSQQSRGLYENIGNISPPLARCSIINETGVTPPSRCSGYSSESRGSSENDLIQYQLETIKSVDMIPDDLSTLSVPGLCDCLHLFELPNVAQKFKQNQIDGHFFIMMSDHMFRDDAFNFSEFELLKIKKLRDGWRPRL